MRIGFLQEHKPFNVYLWNFAYISGKWLTVVFQYSGTFYHGWNGKLFFIVPLHSLQNNPHNLTVSMTPESSYEVKRQEAEKAKLDSLVSALTDKERHVIITQSR